MKKKTEKFGLFGASLIALSGVLGAPAVAQAQDQQASEEESEIVVVGSRIRRDNFNTAAPVQLITREESTAAGFTSTSDTLQSVNATGGAAQLNNAFGGFVVNGGPGVNTIALRGLPATSTLVMLNGRRLTPAGTRSLVGSVDLNTIPNLLVQRVEVLKDGASSVYGSDAVAGVVNIVTDNNLEGWVIEGQYNAPLDGGGETQRISIGGGYNNDRLSIIGSVEYYDRSPLLLSDRDWALCNTDYLIRNPAVEFIDPSTGRPKCYPVTQTGSNGSTINTIGTPTRAGVGAPGSVGTTFNRWRPNASILTGLVGFEGVGGGANNINVRDTFDPRMLDREIISPGTVATAFGAMSYDFGPAEFYAELLGVRRESSQVGYRQLTLDYQKNSPLVPAVLNAIPGNFFNAGGNLPAPPLLPTVGQPLPVYATGIRAFIGFGTLDAEQTVDYNRVVAGVRGDFIFDDWQYDVYAMRGDASAEYAQESFLTDRVFNSMVVVAAPVGTPANLVRTVGANNYMCAITATNPAYGCVPAPELTAATIGGQLDQAFVNWIVANTVGETNYTEWNYSAVVDGPLFDLPAGPVQMVLGVEHRTAEFTDDPDPNSAGQNLYNLTTSLATAGEDSVNEVFFETEVPLLANSPSAYELTATLSGRYTDYESYGSNETYKVSLMYAPVQSFAIRANWGTSYRAPALSEQFAGATSGFLSSANDPCNNYAAIQLTNPVRYANCDSELSNPAFVATSGITVLGAGGAAQGLEAETSDNWTIGFVAQPDDVGGGRLSLAVDYFDITVNDQVTRLGGNNLLILCYDDAGFRASSPFCTYLLPRGGANQLTVLDNYTNISTQIVRGIDYQLRYEHDIMSWTGLLNFQVTQFLEQSTELLPGNGFTEFNGTINTPQYAGKFDFDLSNDDWRLHYGITWVGEQSSMGLGGTGAATPGNGRYFIVDNYFLHEASARYRTDDWALTVGVRNAFDEEPPQISSGRYSRVGNSPIYSGYDYFGRTVFANVSVDF